MMGCVSFGSVSCPAPPFFVILGAEPALNNLSKFRGPPHSRAHDHILKIDPEYRTIPIQPKHRYIFVLGSKKERKDILYRLKPFIREYPKRLSDI